MDNKLDIELFMNLRNNEECLNLDDNIIENINGNFSNNKLKKSQIVQKKTIAVIKNPKLKQIKDKILNKVNLILNKLSENNIENLVIEFIDNIKISSIEDYNEFIRAFYIKILSEINFFKFYIKFFHIIITVYEKVNNYTLEYFYNLIETKFNYDYNNDLSFLDKFPEMEFIQEMEEDKRINNLILIKELIKVNYFNDIFDDYICNKILDQNYLSDIYLWFKDRKLLDNHIKKINIILSKDIQLRDRVLLDNLISGINTDQSENKIIFKKSLNKVDNTKNNNNINISKEMIEINNNLEEYLFIDNSESLEEYIYKNCKDANAKNRFSEFLIEKYLILSSIESQKILLLMKNLIKSKILYKSNLSRGLINLHNNKNISNNDKLKKLLIFLKKMSITNGLELLMNKYKIDLTINL